MQDLLTINQASKWASSYLCRNVTPSNISYLINYGRIEKKTHNGTTFVDKNQLINYYKNSYNGKRETNWKAKLGDDLNWHLSFDYLKEAETTKHVHRLHPYKGKFIPQLVEYFLNDKTDEFKKQIYFNKGDIILDPFCGSGTTLVQANEIGMHAIGIDISAFNALISNVKIQRTDLSDIYITLRTITERLKEFISDKNNSDFENKLLEELNKFNNIHFPSPEYKHKIRNGEIKENEYGKEKEKIFLNKFSSLVDHYRIQILQNKNSNNFIDKWYLKPVREEINFVFEQIKKIQNVSTKKTATIVFSRTIRSCRATTHADLATLKEPVSSTYYCRKHGKICKPLFSILSWWERYCDDTIKRLSFFNKLRTNTFQTCLTGDSRNIDIFKEINTINPSFAEKINKRKINGLFSSPPYVGLIDYHEQHAYAYDLYGFERKDKFEIGPLFKGKGKEAREQYIKGISDVLNNCKRFLSPDFNVFLVANDKFRIYPLIANNAGMKIVQRFRRPVLNRTEKNKNAYSETIFHLKEK